jgi:choline dehydrogenase-like flavoprotein
MIIDANNFEAGKVIKTDICIVGAGAAGIALATELVGTGIEVVLAESGGFAVDKKLQELFDGEVVKGSRHPDAVLYRRRVVGGTTSVWGGRCVPFDEVDFERRDYMPYSGWPFSRSVLLPYYKRANPVCDAGIFDYCADSSIGAQAGDMIPGFASSTVRTNDIERFSRPTDFGRLYTPWLKRSRNVSLVYHATCTAIKLQGNGRRVAKLVFRNLKGEIIEIIAGNYVLAMGGLETTRLLMTSNDVMPNGVGNDSDRLGRFYMCHLASTAAELRIAPKIADVIYDYEMSKDGIYCRRRMALSAEAQRKHGIGNMIARFIYPNAANPEHGNGILSALFLARSLLHPEYRGAFSFNDFLRNKPERVKNDYRAHLRNILLDLPRTLVFSQMIVRKRFLARRKLPSVMLKSRKNAYVLDINAEQSPDPDSRITLLNEKDVFGVPKLRIDWRMNDTDRHTIKTGLAIMRDEFHRSGCGDLAINEDRLENCWPVGGHHIGTTRMATSVSEGVVDENCRVHGVSNLYVASSSVFPTSSHANPTLTIVALAIRLADYLKKNQSQITPGSGG